MDSLKGNVAKLVQWAQVPKPQPDTVGGIADTSVFAPQASAVVSDSLKSLIDSVQAFKQSIEMLKEHGKSVDQARKQAARQRLSQLKDQIQSLKQMLAGMDPKAAKALLAQIKNMSQELRSLAGQLASSSGSDSSSASSLSDFSAEGMASSAGEQASMEAGSAEGENALASLAADTASTDVSEEELNPEEKEADAVEQVLDWQASVSTNVTTQVHQSGNHSNSDKMNKEDAALLGKVRNELKSLVEMLKQKLQLLKSTEKDKNMLHSIDDDLRAVGDSIDQLLSDSVQASLNDSYGAFASFGTAGE